MCLHAQRATVIISPGMCLYLLRGYNVISETLRKKKEEKNRWLDVDWFALSFSFRLCSPHFCSSYWPLPNWTHYIPPPPLKKIKSQMQMEPYRGCEWTRLSPYDYLPAALLCRDDGLTGALARTTFRRLLWNADWKKWKKGRRQHLVICFRELSLMM